MDIRSQLHKDDDIPSPDDARIKQLHTFWGGHPKQRAIGVAWILFQLRAGWKAIFSHPVHSACWIAVSSTCLFFVFSGVFFLSLWDGVERAMETPSRVEIFVPDSVDAAEVKGVLVSEFGEASVEFVDKDDAIERLSVILGPEAKQSLTRFGERNPLPRSFIVELPSARIAAVVAENLRKNEALGERIEEIVIEEDLLLELRSAASHVRWISMIVFTAVGVGVLALVTSLIRLSMHTRRSELEVMRLVGMSMLRRYGSFIFEALLLGIASSLTAAVMYIVAADYAVALMVELTALQSLLRFMETPGAAPIIIISVGFVAYSVFACFLVMRQFERELA